MNYLKFFVAYIVFEQPVFSFYKSTQFTEKVQKRWLQHTEEMPDKMISDKTWIQLWGICPII